MVVHTTEGGVGNWGRWRKQAYMVDISIDAIQEYYENHMGRRCREEVGFETSTNCDDTDYDHCRRSAECSIPRPFGEAKLHEQFFSVQLYAESEDKTWVIQETWWRTP